MDQIIGVTELQRKFRSVFDQVVKEGKPFILTRGSRPEAVLIPYADYVRSKSTDAAALLARFDRVMEKMQTYNAGFSDEEVSEDVEAAIQEVRAEKLTRK